MQPLTYSIAYGVIGGVIAFAIAHAAKYVLDWLSSRMTCCGGEADSAGPPGPADVVKEDFTVDGSTNAKAPAEPHAVSGLCKLEPCVVQESGLYCVLLYFAMPGCKIYNL